MGKKELTKKKLVSTAVFVFVFLIIYMIGSKIYYGKIYCLFGNYHKNIFEIEDLEKVSKDFQIQEDKSFLSVSTDPSFDILEKFYVKTIVIDINEASEICDSQVFYYSDASVLDQSHSYCFKLKRGVNYIQIPDGKYNMFRLDLTDVVGKNLRINRIAVYGYRILPVTFLFLVGAVGLFCSWLVCKGLLSCEHLVRTDSEGRLDIRQNSNEMYQNIRRVLAKYQEKVIISCQFFVLYVVEFGIMMNRHYSLDSFTYSGRSELHYKGHLLTARIGAYIAAFLFKDIDIIKHQIWFVILLIVTMTLSAAIIYNHYIQWISEDRKKRLLLRMAIALMYGNVYMTDFFHFPEAIPPMVFGIIFMTFAVWQIIPNMSIKRLLTITFLMSVSLNCYQVTLGFFIFFALVGIYFINKGVLTKNAFIDSLLVVLFGGIVAGATNVILLRILQSTGVVNSIERTGATGIKEWISNAKQIMQGAFYLFKDTSGFLPRNSLFFILLLLYTLVIIALWNTKTSWRNYLYIFLMIFVCRAMVFAPHILASEVWLAPRSIISYWSIVSLPCVVLVVLSDKDVGKNIAIVSMVCFCLLNIVSIQKIGLNMIAKNRIDEEIAYMIQSKIEDYENKTGMRIYTISFRNDMIPSWYYRSADFGVFELAQRGYTAAWGASVAMVNYFNDENYFEMHMDDEIFRQYFDKENWDCLNLDEQLVFDGNVAYFVAY